MPNHITSILRISGSLEGREAFKAFIAGPERAVDFNSLLPMPPELNSERTSSDAVTIAQHLTGGGDAFERQFGLSSYLAFPWVREAGITTVKDLIPFLYKRDPRVEAETRQLTQNYEKYGCFYWHDWAVAHWGTKWNAYSIGEWKDPNRQKPDSVIEFDTAWAPPEPIFNLMAEKAKQLGIKIGVKWRDEGDGVWHRWHQQASVGDFVW